MHEIERSEYKLCHNLHHQLVLNMKENKLGNYEIPDS